MLDQVDGLGINRTLPVAVRVFSQMSQRSSGPKYVIPTLFASVMTSARTSPFRAGFNAA